MLKPFCDSIPAVIVPVTDRNVDDGLKSVQALARNPRVNIVELRLDYLDGHKNNDILLNFCELSADHLDGKPFIATFRTKEEGGESDISSEQYISLCQAICASGKATFVDIEYNRGDETVEKILKYARLNPIKTILSMHDFIKTDSREKLIAHLEAMKKFDPDIIKLAVMPNSADDVLSLLSATHAMHQEYPDTPLITMSMGKMGALSRMAGGLFGSVATFGTAGRRSAPGQIELGALCEVLEIVHEASMSD
ncbi:type I 3-dehydroquinate dehydratase [Acetobacter tropicalis]|uniref:3-dehydroquinate dehydratase n=1 Tax=Acetobacter tropicalis TaxID=104102 RepID=A0A094YLJ8_9PROT|nr:type I 3-dehydroquinate dehydratase [Acetobacter tropicalis]KAA8385847.1 type I 3-dehydroquinate dehydratase [Acetobacter tropicalis]KAA8391574.1 type I 3-dehydroquinate dehydratase [Acetobacter tropicalis]KGB22207.1 3-dehydroquinate dehydratase I [Acetobacter tropicalis]MBC9008736.1 type I 3-dehydroquinate dehydratase [Acetobacter tropicalis]MDO8173155.1 type I 3-dehydroquinate dehydratase [Acetobacter tropicalis]